MKQLLSFCWVVVGQIAGDHDHTMELATASWSTKAVLALCAASFFYIVVSLIMKIVAVVYATLARLASKVVPQGPAQPAESSGDSAPPTPAKPQAPAGVSLKSLIKSTAKGKGGAASGPDRHADSDLFIATLRGHTDTVTGLAFSADGKLLATACEDRTLRIFDVSDVHQKNIPFKLFSMRQGLRDVAFGPTNTQVVLLTQGTAGAAGMACVDVSGREAAILTDQQNIFAGKAVTGLCLRGSGASGAGGTMPVLVAAAGVPQLRVFLGTGTGLQLLGNVDTGGMQNYNAAVSSDGRFLGAATFASDVKIYEVTFDRQGTCTGVSKVMDLMGHKKKITALEFSPEGSKAVTASEDGMLRVWNLAVRYHLREDPQCLVSVGIPSGKASVTRLAWGRGGYIAAVSGPNVYFLNAHDGKVVDTVLNAHSGEIMDMAWAPARYEGPQGAHTVLATAGSDMRVRLWRGPWHMV